PILDAQGRPIGATTITRDITYRRQAERQLLHGALHDAVTDLPNRASFIERVSQALARMRRDPDYQFSVLFFDCDHFKEVNDTLGHAAGDRLLVEIAQRLRASDLHRSEEHTSELQSLAYLVCRLLLEKKNKK